MPYIKPEDRAKFNDAPTIEDVAGLSSGEVNFLLSRFIHVWWKANPRYSRIAEITGVLENVKQEFYRRIASPYEDEKIKENGDVYN
jgi:hypothetical protein